MSEPEPHEEQRDVLGDFLRRTEQQAAFQSREAVDANREAHAMPDPPVDDPLRARLAQKRARRRLLQHRRA